MKQLDGISLRLVVVLHVNVSFSLSMLQMCRVLLDHDCAVNYLSRTGESPLHILTRKGRFEAAMVLLTHGADSNLKDQCGNTALHLAMKVVLSSFQCSGFWLCWPG